MVVINLLLGWKEHHKGTAARRLSQLQEHILWWLVEGGQRTDGVVAGEHQKLGRTLKEEKGNASHSLRTLEELGLVFEVIPDGV